MKKTVVALFLFAFISTPAHAGKKQELEALREQVTHLETNDAAQRARIEQIEIENAKLLEEIESLMLKVKGMTPQVQVFKGPVYDDLSIEGSVDPTLVKWIFDNSRTGFDDCVTGNGTGGSIRPEVINVTSWVHADGTMPKENMIYEDSSQWFASYIVTPYNQITAECFGKLLMRMRLPSSADGENYRFSWRYESPSVRLDNLRSAEH